MKFETLRNNRKILLGTVIVFVVILTLIISTSLAKYKVTESINIAKGTINYKLADLSVIAMYQENASGGYESIEKAPSSGYKLNNTSSYCDVSGVKDENIVIEYVNGLINFAGVSKKGTKCYLYFDIFEYIVKNTILTNKTVSTRTDFSTTLTTNTTGTIYSAEDDYGTTYYYAGASTDNYVKFAGYYWRIIRINGNGTIRLIYAGTSAITNGTSSSATQIGTSVFNNYSSVDNMYVGYMYTSGYVHGLTTVSDVKKQVDAWYAYNLLDYEEYIDYNTGFCGDRTSYTDTEGTTSGGGTGTTYSYYGGYIRLFKNKIPTFICPNSNDLYTVSKSSTGNKALVYPIGLISADELSFAGDIYAGNMPSSTNKSYYLYTGQNYWTMTPFYVVSSTAVYVAYGVGDIATLAVTASAGIRPVINLRADVTLTGSGTSTDPYTVS